MIIEYLSQRLDHSTKIIEYLSQRLDHNTKVVEYLSQRLDHSTKVTTEQFNAIQSQISFNLGYQHALGGSTASGMSLDTTLPEVYPTTPFAIPDICLLPQKTTGATETPESMISLDWNKFLDESLRSEFDLSSYLPSD